MEFVTETVKKDRTGIAAIFAGTLVGEQVKVDGIVHAVRDMGEVVFVILRKRDGLLQCVSETGTKQAGKGIKEESSVCITGVVRREERAPGGYEVKIGEIRMLSEPAEPLPFAVSKWKLPVSPETNLDHRAIALRNEKQRARFRIQEGIVRGFRDYLYGEGFTEIHTPKIGAKSAEGGANLFKLEYFHRPAVLQQSPQFYKQMLVGVFERVFETGPVFRAEKHSTKRHLNEYTSLDFEMGFIDDFTELMAMETGFLRYTMRLLETEYAREIALLGVALPDTERIPVIRFDEAKRLAAEAYGRQIRSPYDLEPEEEALIGRYMKERYGADFVFVTHYPSKKRPFYAMDDPADLRYTLSFDLLFGGLEITTGGQRIHDYQMLLDKIEKRGMTTEGMEAYLEVFRCGMPPHGGLGIGSERMTMKLIGEDNVRETTLFPRDLSRLEP
ncbi:MAG: aspartate--tRNA(Asn) ligase [Roseburia sp.]|jgi:nondiscriminating aspartyl-tRNA synthetase|nr:aspartate--tRNA(Asn) ligase [Roseburia sp.]